MASDEDKLVRDAAARNGGAVLSLPSAGMLRHCKSRFLAEYEGGILIEAVPEQRILIQTMIDSGERAIVSFKNGVYKVVFGSRILRNVPEFRVNALAAVDALLLEFPQEIKAIQRRTCYRARVSTDSALSARVWRIAERAYLKDNPMSAQEVLCELRDLSVGGMGVRFFTKDGSPPKISAADRLRILFKMGDETLILEGRMRESKTPPEGGSMITGISFKKLEASIEGRLHMASLTRLVGELQRDELRQFRLGLAKAG